MTVPGFAEHSALVKDGAVQQQAVASALTAVDLPLEQLWLRYFTLGGTADLVEIEAYVHGLMPLPPGQRDMLAHAVNERLDDLAAARRVPYSAPMVDSDPQQGLLTALLGVLGGARHALAGELPAAAAAAGTALGVDLTIYLVDYEQVHLTPLPRPGEPAHEPVVVDGTLAGRAFQLLETQTAHNPAEPVLWVPMLDGAERLGVLHVALHAPAQLRDPDLREKCEWIARLLGHLVVGASEHGDAIDAVRSSRPRTAGSQLLWQLLPPLTAASSRFTLSGLIEPAYAAGGDAFDYALSEERVQLAVFDAMGHGLGAGLIAAAALSAYREARRGGHDLLAQAAALDHTIAAQFPDAFVTGVLADLDLSSGRLRYLAAGHPAPLLLRAGRVVTALAHGRRQPFGLEDGATPVGEEALQPEDWLALNTDGVTEARDSHGGFFGAQRLTDFLERAAASAQPPAETVRRLTHAVLAHQHGQLQDDATILLAHWTAADPAPAPDST